MKLAMGERQRATSLPLVLALTSISFFMVALDALVVVTALPSIHASLGGSIATLEWAVNAGRGRRRIGAVPALWSRAGDAA